MTIYGHFSKNNLYIFGINLWTVLYTKLCYNEQCYKEVLVYVWETKTKALERAIQINIVCYFLKKKQQKKPTTYSDSQPTLYWHPIQWQNSLQWHF